MRLRSEADIREFLDTVKSCEGDSLELFADRREDRALLMKMVADLMSEDTEEAC